MLSFASRMAPRLVSVSVWDVVSSPHMTPSSMGFVECGSVNTWAKKNSRNPR